jgi:protein-disulfide isomerase
VSATDRQSDDTVTFKLKHVWGVVGLILGIGLGVLAGTTVLDDDTAVVQLPGGGAEAGAPLEGEEVVDVATDGRPFRGPEDAKVTMVEFTDYECPFCGRHAKDTLPELEKRYGDKVKYVVRNFPLANIHKRATKAAAAAECAFEQDRFWEYHDLLFENQKKLAVADLKKHARTAGLDGAEFDDCLDSGRTAAQVKRDVADGEKYGVTGTPTFFINGHRLEGAQPYGNIGEELDRALKEAG